MSGAVEAGAPATTVAVKAPSKAEEARAAGELAAAAHDARRLRFLAEVADLEADLEAAVEERARAVEAGEATAVAGLAAAHLGEGDVAARIAEAARRGFVEHLDAYAVGAALQAVLDADSEAARIKRLYEALYARAERRAERLRKALEPIVFDWCDAHTPAKGATWKFTSTEAKVVSKAHDGKLEVTHAEKAVESLQQALGVDAYEALRVKTEVAVGKAKDLLVVKGLDPSKLAGFAWTPPGKRKEIHVPGGRS